MRAAERSFTTAPEDHGNCSVGRFTHGLASLEDVGGNDDVAALLESGWVDAEAVGGIPSISERPEVITYGPVAESASTPDVVLLRVNGRQMMVLSDALPGLKIEGKPQCHIVALAKEHGEVAASVGCALSRARTGMRPDEMTLALPGRSSGRGDRGRRAHRRRSTRWWPSTRPKTPGVSPRPPDSGHRGPSQRLVPATKRDWPKGGSTAFSRSRVMGITVLS